MVSKTAIIHSNVVLGKNVTIEDYCIVGQPFAKYNNEPTIIGDNTLIRAHTIIYAGNQIGKNFQTGNKANIREYNKIGDDVSIGTLSIVEYNVVIEDGVRIHSQVFIPEYTVIKKKAWIGPNVVLTNAKFPLSPDVKKNLKGAVIEEGAIIGANATVLPGVQIGKNSLVGAGSVVVKDVPAGAIVMGNPARQTRKRDY